MARSNSNQDRTGGQPGRPARAAQPVDHGLPWHPGAQAHVPPQDPQFSQGYDTPPTSRPQTGPPPAMPGQLPWPQAGQFAQPQPPPQLPPQHYVPQPAYPNAPQQQAYAQPAYPPQAYQQPTAYPADPHSDPRNGHYFPQQPAEQPPAYPAAAYQDPAPQLRGTYPGHSEPSFAPPPGPQGGYPPQYHPQPPAHDTGGYELGAYATAPAGYGEPAPGRGQPAPLPPGYVNDYNQPEPGFGAPRGADADEDFDDGEYDEDEEYDEEEDDEPRRFGVLKIVASLAVAIAIGAGGAFAYKKFGIAGAHPQVARAEVAPIKLQTASAEANPGIETKSGDRIGEPIPAVVPSNEGNGESPSGARRVQTIAIMPPGAAPAQPQAPIRPTISVPGLAVGDMAIGQPQPAPAMPQASIPSLPPVTPAPAGRAVAPPPVTQQRAPIAPKVIAAVEEPAAAPARPVPQHVAAAKVAVARAPKTNDAYTPGGAPSAVGAVNVATATTAPATKASNGYVAVLASLDSAIDARKTLDTLQTKFGEVLGGKPTDVTEFSSPKDGKTYYRAIVGPPGSREAAVNICSQIRAAGHKDCFAAAY